MLFYCCRLACPMMIALSAVNVSQAFSPPMSPESFLTRPAASVADLIGQVKSDAAACHRYARFFGIKDAQVVPFLRSQIVAGAVSTDGFYTVTCVQSSGTFYPTKQSLRRGERVFCRRDGRPVLQWRSGNPLTPFATATELVSVPATPRPAIEKLAPTTSPSVVIPAGDFPVSSMPRPNRADAGDAAPRRP